MNRRSPTPRCRLACPAFVLALLGIALTLAPVLAQDTPPRTVQEGVFTVEQAERGTQVYKRSCADCHPMDLYRGDVMKSWEGASLFGLYDLILNRMPQNNPGSLKRREYVELLAYILSLNEMPAGATELPTDESALKKIVIKWRKKP